MSNLVFCTEYSRLLKVEPVALIPLVTRMADLLFSFSGDKRNSAESFLKNRFRDSLGLRIKHLESVDEQIFMLLREENEVKYNSFYMGNVPKHYRNSHNVTFYF